MLHIEFRLTQADVLSRKLQTNHQIPSLFRGKVVFIRVLRVPSLTHISRFGLLCFSSVLRSHRIIFPEAMLLWNIEPFNFVTIHSKYFSKHPAHYAISVSKLVILKLERPKFAIPSPQPRVVYAKSPKITTEVRLKFKLSGQSFVAVVLCSNFYYQHLTNTTRTCILVTRPRCNQVLFPLTRFTKYLVSRRDSTDTIPVTPLRHYL